MAGEPDTSESPGRPQSSRMPDAPAEMGASGTPVAWGASDTSGKSDAPSRRGFIVFAGMGAIALALPPLVRRMRGEAGLAPHPFAPGFREAGMGSVSGTLDPFAGLMTPDPSAIPPATPDNLCAALFRDSPPGADGVKTAFFTDIACPYCREMEPMVAAAAPALSVSWHDLPLLGDASVTAARAIAAARLQGAEEALRARLTRSRFRPERDYLADLASGLDLDTGRLLEDMHSARTTARIAETLGVADALALPGTPALVVGDIVAAGRRDRAGLDALVAASAPPPC